MMPAMFIIRFLNKAIAQLHYLSDVTLLGVRLDLQIQLFKFLSSSLPRYVFYVEPTYERRSLLFSLFHIMRYCIYSNAAITLLGKSESYAAADGRWAEYNK
jgi:hypothetical protein